jgi:hypothetical protein
MSQIDDLRTAFRDQMSTVDNRLASLERAIGEPSQEPK